MTANDASTLLKSWNDGAATQAIVEFVDRATREGDAGYIAPSDRVAVFDNDRHAVVRETDADRARLHPAAAGGDV